VFRLEFEGWGLKVRVRFEGIRVRVRVEDES
jgi:hypothetical protein